MSVFGRWTDVGVWKVDCCQCLEGGLMSVFGRWTDVGVWKVD